MSQRNYLDKTGLGYFWGKIKTYVNNAVKVTGVKGNAESSYRTGNVNLTPANIGSPTGGIAKGGIQEPLNTFAPGNTTMISIDRLENAFYFADQRFTVTAIVTSSGGSQSSAVSSRLFDMNPDSRVNIPAGGMLVVTIDFSEQSGGVFPNYPYGYAYLNFYYTSGPEQITARVYGKHTGSTSYWKNCSVIADPKNATAQIRYIVDQTVMYNMQKIEFTITAPSFKSAELQQICYYLTRGDRYKDLPYVSKLKAEKLYFDLTAPTFIGALNGNASTATNASKVNNHTVNSDVPANAVFTDTTYSSKTAASGGTDVSLVTTGEKYTWNNKPSSNVELGQGYGTCTNSSTTTACTVTLANYVLSVGGIVVVKFSNGVQANSTLNVNSKGAKPIKYQGANIAGSLIRGGDIVTFIYDGTNYHVLAIDRVANSAAVPADYVTATASNLNSGLNGYTMWASGKLEIWLRQTVTGVNINNAYGNMYYGSISAISYQLTPTSPTFVQYPVVNITVQGPAGIGIAVPNYDNYSTTDTGTIYLYNPASVTNKSVTVNIYAVGRWKLE